MSDIIIFTKHRCYIITADVNIIFYISGFHCIHFDFKATASKTLTLELWEFYVKFYFWVLKVENKFCVLEGSMSFN